MQSRDELQCETEEIPTLKALVDSQAQELQRLQEVADANADRAVALGAQLDLAYQDNQAMKAELQAQVLSMEQEVQALKSSASERQAQLQDAHEREAAAVTDAQHAQQAYAGMEQKHWKVSLNLQVATEEMAKSQAAVQDLQERFDELSQEAEEALTEQAQQLSMQHAQDIQKLTDSHRVALDEMEQGHQALIAALEERYQMRVAAVQAEHKQAQEEAESQHAQRIQQLNARIEKLMDQQAQELASQVRDGSTGKEEEEASDACQPNDDGHDMKHVHVHASSSLNTPVDATADSPRLVQGIRAASACDSQELALQGDNSDPVSQEHCQGGISGDDAADNKLYMAHEDGPASSRPTGDHDLGSYPGLQSRSSRESASSYYSQEQLSRQLNQVQIQLADLEIQLASSLEDLGNENERARKLEELLAEETNKSWLMLRRLNAVEEERDRMQVRLNEQRGLLEAASQAAHTQANSLATQLDTLAVTWERERGGLAEQLEACQRELEVCRRKLVEAEQNLQSERQAAQHAAMQHYQLMEALTTAQHQVS